MSDPPKFSQNAFKNGAAFVAELEAILGMNYSHDAVQRILRRTIDAYARLQLAIIDRSLPPKACMEQALRAELFDDDFKAWQMKQLSTLISSFITLETPLTASSLDRAGPAHAAGTASDLH